MGMRVNDLMAMTMVHSAVFLNTIQVYRLLKPNIPTNIEYNFNLKINKISTQYIKHHLWIVLRRSYKWIL